MLDSLLNGFLNILYPRLCWACGEHVPSKETAICIQCQYRLPKTNFHEDRENPVSQRFWGRTAITFGTSFYYFVKGGRVQNLIHYLKYEGKGEIGVKIGQLYGTELLNAEDYKQFDLIVPVPLHPKKLKMRGYNQSDLFAQGLSESMNIPYYPNLLQRTKMTATQTSKSRMERFENVSTAFRLNQGELIKNKHVLLVDDVITTGATLEVCANILLEDKTTKVSVATMAFAGEI